MQSLRDIVFPGWTDDELKKHVEEINNMIRRDIEEEEKFQAAFKEAIKNGYSWKWTKGAPYLLLPKEDDND